MKTKTKCRTTELLGEAVIGLTIGGVVKHALKDDITNGELISVFAVAGIAAYTVGHTFGVQFFRLCDKKFGTDFNY